MEKQSVNERVQIMGFHIGTTLVFGFLEGTCRQILGQVMNLNYFRWIFNLCC
jgi:hypothetical protein